MELDVATGEIFVLVSKCENDIDVMTLCGDEGTPSELTIGPMLLDPVTGILSLGNSLLKKEKLSNW